jgi:tRNA pseudouridine38-40 synthase
VTTHRFRATVAYDGTNYLGFQRQRSGDPTIQGALEAALQSVRGAPVAVLGSGRTDAGVHALGQVVSFQLEWPHEPRALLRALNATLPDDIVIRSLSTVATTFHPRFDALRRHYRYHVYNEPVRSPIRRRYAWHVARPLDLDDMNEAAARLLGSQDFGTFGRPPQGESTVREVFHARWQKAGSELTFDIAANAFLYRMVRSLVGALVLVGQGRWTPDAFAAALVARDRSRTVLLAPACGLFLMSVAYE